MGTQKQRETERHIQSRRGSRPSHPMGAKYHRETLLPSREEVKEEEEGGWISLPRFWWHRSAIADRQHHHKLHHQLHHHHHQLFPALCSGVTPLLPAVIST